MSADNSPSFLRIGTSVIENLISSKKTAPQSEKEEEKKTTKTIDVKEEDDDPKRRSPSFHVPIIILPQDDTNDDDDDNFSSKECTNAKEVEERPKMLLSPLKRPPTPSEVQRLASQLQGEIQLRQLVEKDLAQARDAYVRLWEVCEGGYRDWIHEQNEELHKTENALQMAKRLSEEYKKHMDISVENLKLQISELTALIGEKEEEIERLNEVINTTNVTGSTTSGYRTQITRLEAQLAAAVPKEYYSNDKRSVCIGIAELEAIVRAIEQEKQRQIDTIVDELKLEKENHVLTTSLKAVAEAKVSDLDRILRREQEENAELRKQITNSACGLAAALCENENMQLRIQEFKKELDRERTARYDAEKELAIQQIRIK